VIIEDAMGVGLQTHAGTTSATDVLVRDNAVGLDTNGGTLTEKRVELTGNSIGRAKTAEPYPTLPWGVEVPNKGSAKSYTTVLDEGTYGLSFWSQSSTTCGVLPYYYSPPQYVGLAWQGDNEFTIGTPGAEAAPACIYDGKDATCTTYTWQRAIDETSVLTATVVNTGFNINKTTSWGWAQTITFDCEGDWCSSGSFPCDIEVGMRYDIL